MEETTSCSGHEWYVERRIEHTGGYEVHYRCKKCLMTRIEYEKPRF